MARLKTKIISINDLRCKDVLINELKSQMNSEDYDFSTISVFIKGKGPSPFIVDKAIKSLERYYLCNKHLIETINSEQIIRRNQLAKMLSISRPTLNKWIYSTSSFTVSEWRNLSGPRCT